MTTTPMDDPRIRAHAEHLLKIPQDRQFRTIVKWLTGQDEGRLAVATEAAIQNGAAAAPLLVREALAPRRQIHQRVRLLEVVETIGKPLELEQWFDLCRAAARYGPEVKDQIARVLAAHRRAG